MCMTPLLYQNDLENDGMKERETGRGYKRKSRRSGLKVQVSENRERGDSNSQGDQPQRQMPPPPAITHWRRSRKAKINGGIEPRRGSTAHLRVAFASTDNISI